MERLTEYVTGGIRIKGCSTIYPDTERKGAPAANAIVRLAAYEDTGLEPCDYAVMRSAMDQAKEATQQLSDVVRILGCSDIDRLKDLAQAEKDGRLVVLPDAKYTDADGEKALQKAMWDCCNTNNPVTRYTADAIAEKLCREARAENPPLTLEELRGMGLFEWLWVEVIHPTKSQLLRKVESAYYQVFEDYTDGDSICCGWPGLIHDFAYEDYGKNWLAYRRKPEEEARRDA